MQVASLPLQIALHLDGYFQFIYYVLTCLGLFYKSFIFNFGAAYFVAELLGLTGLLALAYLRLFVGSKGNKTETSHVTAYFLLLTVCTCLANFYFLQFQSFVLRLDLLLGGASLALSGFEFVFACFAAIEFKSLENSR